MANKVILHEPTDIFSLKVDAIVNPVNIRKIAGAGLAKQFAEKYPEEHLSYLDACEQNAIGINKVHVASTRQNFDPKYIIYFATKDHWRDPSRYLYITLGLSSLEQEISIYKIKSIAIPALGCGLGQLEFEVVKALVWDELKVIKDLDVFLMAPH